jgi:hypothetical protein
VVVVVTGTVVLVVDDVLVDDVDVDVLVEVEVVVVWAPAVLHDNIQKPVTSATNTPSTGRPVR